MDQQLLFLINRQWTIAALDWLMAAVSSFGAWGAPLLVLVLVLLIRGDFKMRAFLVTAGIIVGINDGLVSNPLKRIVDRPRPHQVLAGVRQVDLANARPRLLALFRPVKVRLSRVAKEDVAGRSFPSSHTMNTLSAALVAVAFFGWSVAWGLGLAALVGYSRIYTGAHWPSDIAVSAVLACGTTLALLGAAEWLWRRFGGRWHARHPSLFAA